MITDTTGLEHCFVSVIVPVYNDQPGIDACVRALADQTWPRNCYEVIVVDNGSEPPIILNSSVESVARVVKCSASGSYAARNTGIKEAIGDVFAFTDADCLAEPGWIESGVSAVREKQGMNIIGGEVGYMVDEKPNAVERYQLLCGFGQKENIEQRGFCATANLFVLKSTFFQVGYFDDKLLSGGDLLWCWRAREMGFKMVFEKTAVVKTSPRKTLKSAIKQVRRVAGGRYFLFKEKKVPPEIKTYAGKRRGAWEAVKWIFSQPGLTMTECVRILSVSSILKIAHTLETIKLKFGSCPERG